jgi:hypothetical protein
VDWHHLYLIVGIAALLIGIWKLAKGSRVVPPLLGILWFLVVLFQYFIPEAYRLVLIKGMPSLGNVLHYLALPALIILLLAIRGHRI